MTSKGEPDFFLLLLCDNRSHLLLLHHRCEHAGAAWAELEEACSSRAAHLSKAVTREQVRESRRRCGPAGILSFLCLQLLLDCSELESRLTETLGLVNTDDCGRSQPATHSLITKHQVRQKLLFFIFTIFYS